MFSFARTVMDMIQSATGLNVKPGSIDDSREEEKLYRSHSTKQGKGCDLFVLLVIHSAFTRFTCSAYLNRECVIYI